MKVGNFLQLVYNAQMFSGTELKAYIVQHDVLFLKSEEKISLLNFIWEDFNQACTVDTCYLKSKTTSVVIEKSQLVVTLIFKLQLGEIILYSALLAYDLTMKSHKSECYEKQSQLCSGLKQDWDIQNK